MKVCKISSLIKNNKNILDKSNVKDCFAIMTGLSFFKISPETFNDFDAYKFKRKFSLNLIYISTKYPKYG